jgi:hypothetical protein
MRRTAACFEHVTHSKHVSRVPLPFSPLFKFPLAVALHLCLTGNKSHRTSLEQPPFHVLKQGIVPQCHALGFHDSKAFLIVVRGKVLSFLPTTAILRHDDRQNMSWLAHSEVQEDKQCGCNGSNNGMSPGLRAAATPCSAKTKWEQTWASNLHLSIETIVVIE